MIFWCQRSDTVGLNRNLWRKATQTCARQQLTSRLWEEYNGGIQIVSAVFFVCEGLQKGRQEARMETLRDDIKNVMESLKMGVEAAMKVLKIREEDRAILKKMI